MNHDMNQDMNSDNIDPVQSSLGPGGTGDVTQDDKTWGMLAHLSTFVGFLIPFGNVVAPLIIYLVKKDQSAFVGDQAKESLNFQITVTIGYLIGGVTSFICVGLIILLVLVVADVVYTVMAAIDANKGNAYRYPYTLRLVN